MLFEKCASNAKTKILDHAAPPSNRAPVAIQEEKTANAVTYSIPFYFFGLSISDAIFESVSGITTTGATTIVGLDSLPKSILLYRQLLQWIGGMGLIVLAVAVMPALGIGRGQL